MNRTLQLANLTINLQDRDIANSNGNCISLRPLSFKVLSLLISNVGHCISRDEFFKQCWNGAIVTDQALTNVISNIRNVFLRLKAQGIQLITISKIGYKLCIEPSENSANADSVDTYNVKETDLDDANTRLAKEGNTTQQVFKVLPHLFPSSASLTLVSTKSIFVSIFGLLIALCLLAMDAYTKSDSSNKLNSATQYRKYNNINQTLYIDDNSSSLQVLTTIEKSLSLNQIDSSLCQTSLLFRFNDSDANKLTMNAIIFNDRTDESIRLSKIPLEGFDPIPSINKVIHEANSLCS
ncbi:MULTISPECIES: winged helix-turn-helix domain-containing protein [Vibrio]|uniref:winged helix-turn-helix domain-containing protein n=1 Tax=Vibrio TaxID=662 RepID=UPI00142F0287|nr:MULTISPECIES: winged helix-turn-helix domain-containing protein [Vibrio]